MIFFFFLEKVKVNFGLRLTRFKVTKELGSSSVAEPEFSVEGPGLTHHDPPPTEVTEDAESKNSFCQKELKTGDETH